MPVAICLGIAAFLAQAVQPEASWVELKSAQFTVLAPAGFTLVREKQVDFVLFHVGDGTKSYVTVYVGNFPDFPGRKPGPGEVLVKSRLDMVETASLWRGNTVLAREVKVPLLQQGRLRGFIHAFTEQAAPSDFNLADRILSSFQASSGRQNGARKRGT